MGNAGNLLWRCRCVVLPDVIEIFGRVIMLILFDPSQDIFCSDGGTARGIVGCVRSLFAEIFCRGKVLQDDD